MPDGTISNSSYAFVNTGIHVWQNSSITDVPMGNSNMYGQNYVYCLYNNQDPRCLGGDNEADHYFYFTHAVSKQLFYLCLVLSLFRLLTVSLNNSFILLSR